MTFDILRDASPEDCLTVALDCQTCTQRAARDLAALCVNLSATGIESVFGRMYPSPGCAEMLPTFVQAYFEATEPVLLILLAAAAAA